MNKQYIETNKKDIFLRIDYVVAPWGMVYKTPVYILDEWHKLVTIPLYNFKK